MIIKVVTIKFNLERNMIMKLRCLISIVLVVMLVFSSAPAVNAESWSVAEELGFDVDKVEYDSYCWISERSTNAIYDSKLAGVVYYQTCACREKTSYLNQYSKFTQMTRTIAEPNEIEVTYEYFLWIDKTSTLKFQIDYVEMYEDLDDGQRISDYFATSPAIDATTVVNNGWTIGSDADFSNRNIVFGNSGSVSVSYSSTEGVATAYNSTRIEEYFKVRFTFKDLTYEPATQEQKNLGHNGCSFYTGVSYYGSPSIMEEFSHGSSYDVVFSGYYTMAIVFGGVEMIPAVASATQDFSFVYYTY